MNRPSVRITPVCDASLHTIVQSNMLARPIAEASRSTLTRTRALLELTLAYTLILVVIWTPAPVQRIVYIVTVITLAAILALSFEGPRALGIRRTNLLRSLWIALVALALAAALILAAARLHTLHNTAHFITRYWGYALWAFVQQILLQDVFLRRLLLLGLTPRAAALAAAILFALAHLPNPILTPITLLWGFLSCLLFLRYRNIIPLAIAHAALGITLAVTIPAPIIRNMRVGLGFLHYPTHHHARINYIRVGHRAWYRPTCGSTVGRVPASLFGGGGFTGCLSAESRILLTALRRP